MMRRGRFFEKAELESNWPIRFLIIVVGMMLAMFEGGLALWPTFYGATPLLSLIFLYWVALHYEKYVLMFTGFAIGITSDILFSDLLGGRATAYIAVVFLVNVRRQRLLQSDFRDIWLEFSIFAAAVILFQLLVFAALNFAFPAITPVFFQVGVTMILFPIGYVIMTAANAALGRFRTS